MASPVIGQVQTSATLAVGLAGLGGSARATTVLSTPSVANRAASFFISSVLLASGEALIAIRRLKELPHWGSCERAVGGADSKQCCRTTPLNRYEWSGE